MPNHTQNARNHSQRDRVIATTFLFLVILIFSPQVKGKINVDFDPGLDFSKFKTFAYIGGVNKLEFRRLDPNLISNQVHAEVSRAMIQRGLRYPFCHV